MKSKINILIDNFVKKILEIEDSIGNLEQKVNSINELLYNLIDFCIKKKIYFYIENNIGYNKIINSFKHNLIKFIQKLIDPSNNLISKYIQKLNEDLNNYSDINSLLFRKFKSASIDETEPELESKSEPEPKPKPEPEPKSNLKNTKSDKKKSVSISDSINIIGYDDNNDGFEFNSNYFNDNDSYSKLFPKTFLDVKTKSTKLSKILNSDDSNDSTESDESDKSDKSDKSEQEDNNSLLDKQIDKQIDKQDNSSELFDYEENNKLGLYIKVLLSQNKHIVEFVEKLNGMCKIISDPDIKYNPDNPFE